MSFTSRNSVSFVRLFRLSALFTLTIALTASQACAALVLHNVRYVLYSNVLYVTGNVTDTNGANTEGYEVDYTGDVSGTTVVDSDGEIAFMTPFTGAYGEASLQANDGSGGTSNVVSIEFVE